MNKQSSPTELLVFNVVIISVQKDIIEGQIIKLFLHDCFGYVVPRIEPSASIIRQTLYHELNI